ncbi:MAG TPA: hypothetical protein VHB77_17475, partial [Planctomycetaceae bacterium]|nr:hypothetical protein [Planctomycetaceae bacterium]
MNRRIWLSCVAVVCTATSLLAGEIGFIEDFSLAPDRTVPLAQLIPGTEDYYYYHCLHYQNTEQFEKADATLKQWVERYNYTPRAVEIQNRQALLTYTRNPQPALELIRQRLGLHFNHQREQLNQKPNLPTKLDPKQIGRETLQAIALQIYPNSLQGFENAALEWLIQQKLSVDQRRQLIERLTRPDYPNLPALIAADLNAPNSGGFGQFGIHQQLLRAQLDELLKLKPELIQHEPFINAYILKLHPTDDVNWRQDPKALEAYLDRLWAFVKDLAPAYNSLKAHVLYHRLVYDRAHGVYNTDRFLTYLQLPRQTGYAEPKYLDRFRNVVANLQRDYTAVTLLAPVHDDEPLVRSYLEQMFVEADDYKSLTTYIQSEYLKHVFAETKIVNGLGDPERWYSLLPPATYQALKERVDIEFAYANKTEFGSDEAVGLDVFVKNVDTLIVKVFEINAQNYYRQNQHEIQTDINLDGLVANEEKTVTYQEPALRRVRRHFEFPTLKKRGVYVIDFIGNGKSSRALVRKGRLHFLVRTSIAGQIFTVLDDKQQKVENATLWHAGTLYAADKEGLITVPFSNQPGRQPIVLSQGTFASLNHFNQEPEQYELAAGIYVDREELLARRKARVLIRPTLRVTGTPVSLKTLEEIRLVVTSVDLDNVSTTKEVGDFKLYDDRESVYEFQVPQRTASITFRLQAKIKNYSQNQKVDLASQQTYALNEIDRTDKIEDLHLVEADGQYFVDLLGKTGERLVDRPVQFSFKHRDFRQAQNAVLQTDAKGRIALGALADIEHFSATSPENVSHTWILQHDHHSHPLTLHGAVETTIQVPFMRSAEKPERSELSLLELRGNTFVADRFDALSLKDGLLNITGLPAGDYSLLLKRSGAQTRIRVTEGPQRYGYVLGNYRQLELVNPKPVQIAPLGVDKDKVRIRIENANKFTRVHVFATRYSPAYSACGIFSSITASEPYYRTINRVDSLYVAGRNIGDEYRYILDRRFQKK